MDKKLNRNKIFRELLSVVIGSRLTAAELRSLADLLQSDPSFLYEFSKSIYELSRRVEPQSALPWPEIIDGPNESSDDGLLSLAYNVVQRRRTSKRALHTMLSLIAPRAASMIDPEIPTKEMLRLFFRLATTAQGQRLLRELGMDVAQDPYLSEIVKRSDK